MSEQAHFEKYEAIAQAVGPSRLTVLIPVSARDIRMALATGDTALNSIPLNKWDRAHHWVRIAVAPHIDIYKGWSLAQSVCLLKHVARYHYA